MRGLLRFFFECEDGWFQSVFLVLGKTLDGCPPRGRYPGFRGMAVRASGEREYGTLDFYSMPATDRFSKLIDEAETESARACELCGRPGLLREKGFWYTTFCSPCGCGAGYSEVVGR